MTADVAAEFERDPGSNHKLWNAQFACNQGHSTVRRSGRVTDLSRSQRAATGVSELTPVPRSGAVAIRVAVQVERYVVSRSSPAMRRSEAPRLPWFELRVKGSG
jgi:hypothetical protein